MAISKGSSKSAWETLSSSEQTALAAARFDEDGWYLLPEHQTAGAALAALRLVKLKARGWALTPPGHNARSFRQRKGWMQID